MNEINVNKILENINTKEFGKEIYYLKEIDSTNTYIKQNITKYKNGSLIIAETQTAGRGRQGNKWFSNYGKGIWMSLLIKPQKELKDIIKITTIIGIAIQKAISNIIGKNVYIKWPNDIIIENKKVCGILVESIIRGNSVQALIVGIGVNVKHREEDFKELPNATSIELITDGEVNREELICEILKSIENEYKTHRINIEHLEKISILMNKKVKIISAKKEFLGQVIGFLEDGAIIIKTDSGIMTFKESNISIRGLKTYVD